MIHIVLFRPVDDDFPYEWILYRGEEVHTDPTTHRSQEDALRAAKSAVHSIESFVEDTKKDVTIGEMILSYFPVLIGHSQQEEMLDHLLWSVTPFPAGTMQDVETSIKKYAHLSKGDPSEALRIADDEMRTEFEQYKKNYPDHFAGQDWVADHHEVAP